MWRTLTLARVDIRLRLVLLLRYKPEQNLRYVLAEQLPALVMPAELKLVPNKAKKIVTALVSPLLNAVADVRVAKNVLTVLVLRLVLLTHVLVIL